MAHGITEFDQMFSVREKPWHGLGVILPELATAAEAIDAANLGWKVEKIPAFYQSPVDGMFKIMPDGYITARQDTGAAFGQVGRHYTPLQNVDAFKFMDELTQDPNGPKYVTAGSLHGGRKVWMLVKLPSFIRVNRDDVVEQFLLLSNTHDGSRSVEILWTPVRVVCQNTLSFALNGSKGDRLKVRHMPNMMTKVAQAADILGIVRENTVTLESAIDAMRDYTPTRTQVAQVLNDLFVPKTEGKKGGELTTQTKNILEECINLYRDGSANRAAGDTSSAWALYNGITEFVDHKRTTRAHGTTAAEARFDSSMFGTGAALKAQALDSVLALIK